MEQGFSVLFAGFASSMTACLFLAGMAVMGYLLGCSNGAVIVSKYILHDDIRQHGSGNAGLTNFHRTFGGKLTLLVLAVDVVKMLVAVFLARFLLGLFLSPVPVVISFWTGFFCALGHMFPVMFQFRGGKGILSGGALALTLDWRIGVAVFAVFFLFSVLTRFVSLGSCLAAATFPVASIWVYQTLSVGILAVLFALLILWQHRANIVRLCQGKESKFSLHRKKVES